MYRIRRWESSVVPGRLELVLQEGYGPRHKPFTIPGQTREGTYLLTNPTVETRIESRVVGGSDVN